MFSYTLVGWKRRDGFLGRCERAGKAKISGLIMQQEQVSPSMLFTSKILIFVSLGLLESQRMPGK